MYPKPRTSAAKIGSAKPGPIGKRGKGIAETARLFLDVDEMIRRSSQTVSLSRYVE